VILRTNLKYLKFSLVGAIFLILMSCSQGLNWREITVGDTSVSVWLPCKPNNASRQIPLSEDPRVGEITVNMTGCEQDGMQFAVSYIDTTTMSELDLPVNAQLADGGKSLKSFSKTELTAKAEKSVQLSKASKSVKLEQWLGLWQKASLKSLGVNADDTDKPNRLNNADIALLDWTHLKGELNPRAKFIEMKGANGLEAKYIWFGYQDILYQVAVYSSKPLAAKKDLLETFFSSLEIKKQ
jgi:hypothetical protein